MPTRPKKPNLIALIIPPILVVAAIVFWFATRNRSEEPAPAPTVATPPTAADNGPPITADTGDLATRIYTRGMKSIHGDGVPQDTNKGVQLVTQAAQLGNADAACTVGKIYAKGDGVKKDDAQAFRWFTKAAQKGNVEGMTLLATAYEQGVGTAADPVAAKTWRDKATAAGAGGAPAK